MDNFKVGDFLFMTCINDSIQRLWGSSKFSLPFPFFVLTLNPKRLATLKQITKKLDPVYSFPKLYLNGQTIFITLAISLTFEVSMRQVFKNLLITSLLQSCPRVFTKCIKDLLKFSGTHFEYQSLQKRYAILYNQFFV